MPRSLICDLNARTRTEVLENDYVLAKPDLYQVMYNAQSEAELSETTCNKFYESISIKPNQTTRVLSR
jgi:hypothetical protein